MSLRLPNDLLTASVFPHPAHDMACIETHASWVILAGDYAYKIKKPVNFGFLDFSTQEKRLAACQEEMRINRRTAPQLYDALVSIQENPASISGTLTGNGVETAIRMKRFSQSALLSHALSSMQDATPLMEALAQHVAGFHHTAAHAPVDGSYGTPEAVLSPVAQNIQQLRNNLEDAELLTLVDHVAQWVDRTFPMLKPVFSSRLANGHVRECHGDMHRGNIIVLDGNPVLFDALEFNASLRWIDVISDVAFLVMDMEADHHGPWGWHFLNQWLEETGDYASLTLLPWYLCYRAMVRAKVAALRLKQLTGETCVAARNECLRYLQLAAHYTQPRDAVLLLTHGISGSGKTTHSHYLVDHAGLIRIRADVERKRLFGLGATETSRHIPGGIYHEEANRRTQERLESLARTVLTAGYPALVDATFIRHEPRDRMKALASVLQIPWYILAFSAAPALMRQRAAQRATQASDASEANEDIVDKQLAALEPLNTEEESQAIVINTDTPPDWSSLFPRFLSKTRLRSIST